MEIPRLGVESELQLLAYATATATRDPSHICDHSSWQCWIPNPLSKTRDQTHILMDTSGIHFHCTTMGTLELPTSSCKEVTQNILRGEAAFGCP